MEAELVTTRNTARAEEDKARVQQIIKQEILYGWQVVDSSHLERSPLWYFVATTAAIIMIVYAIFTQAWTFVVAIAMLAGVVYLMAQEPPHVRDVVITKMGIHINRSFYPYNQIKSFWIMSEPDYNALYFRLHGKSRHIVHISLGTESPAYIREILGQELEEETERAEQSVDRLARKWKL